MNEKDLEKRLRSVASGEQPPAPESLRRFLREMPAAQTRRRRGPLGLLGRVRDGSPPLAPQMPLARKLQVAGAVAFAVVVAIVGSSLLISLRGAPRRPLASQSPQTEQPSQLVTPRRTSPELKVVALTLPDNPYWYGTTQYGNDDEALPVVTAMTSANTYVGISSPPYGLNGIVRSDMGLFWDWSPISEVDAGLSELTSITSDTTGRLVVVGWALGEGGVKDGRAYLSDDGRSWHPAADQSVFAGTVVRTVVHGPRGFVALGWNDAGGAAPIRPVMEWLSQDGLNWTRISEVPVEGTAFVFATAAGYVLSGQPLNAGAYDQPPFWNSVDGTDWQRAGDTDNTAGKLGPLSSLTLTSTGTLVGLSQLKDGSGTELVESIDQGIHWHTIAAEGLGMPSALMRVASLSGGADKQWLIATYSSEYRRLYVSRDGGRTWKEAFSSAGSPLGDMLVVVGPGYGAGNMRVLAFGQPSYRLGIFIATAEQVAWP